MPRQEDVPVQQLATYQRRRADLASLSVEAARDVTVEDPYSQALRAVRDTLARDYAKLLTERREKPEPLRRALDRLIEAQSLTREEKQRARLQLGTEYFGYGLLDRFMRDPTVTEVIVDGPDAIDIERDGRLERVRDPAIRWRNDEDLLEYVKGLIRDTGRSIDAAHPIVDAEIQGGVRLNATMPPVTSHVTLNLRKPPGQTRRFTLSEYVETGATTWEGMRLLLALARAERTLLICGRTGSGKTQLQRLLIEHGCLPDVRWIMLEDVRETEAQVQRWVSMQVVERQHLEPIGMPTLFAATKRKRPDRITLGEIRSGDHAVPFLMTTMAGHEGAISTMHAGDEWDALFNFVFFLKQGGLTIETEFLERMFHRQVHVVVAVDRLRDGRRRVKRIVEVEPLTADGAEGFRVLMQWDWRTDRLVWRNPLSDRLAEALEERGVVVPKPEEPVPDEAACLRLDQGAPPPSKRGRAR